VAILINKVLEAVLEKSVCLHTIGCRLNFSETATIAQKFQDRGYSIVEFGNKADVTVLNTCTVTDGADSTCRNLIRRSHRSSPEGKIVVVGCYAQMEPDSIADMKGVDLVLGTNEKQNIFKYLDEEHDNKVQVELTNEFWGAATTKADSHTRAFLKIQDGCNYICSFCIIPKARGRSRAISISEAVIQAKKLIENGFKEIVLTGVNIGEYEKSTGVPFYKLVDKILELDGLKRLRLSSVEPNTFSENLLSVLKSSDKVMNHFHIPMQSGDDEILSRMRRRYTVAEYIKVIDRIKNLFPDAGIGADIILGHPGESKKHFENTFNLLRDLPITHFHPFPFSKRKGTMSASMEDQVHSATKKDRVKQIIDLGNIKLESFSKQLVGKTNFVLFEKKSSDGLYEGYSTNFARVFVNSERNLSNMILPVSISDYQNNRLIGKILN
jgi:threonylcarbamoyladenosine tRNA methylthiotransferase MtaB